MEATGALHVGGIVIKTYLSMYVSGLNHFEQPLAWDCQRAIRSPVVPALSRDSTYHLARYQTNEAAYLINNNGIILLVGMMMMSQE